MVAEAPISSTSSAKAKVPRLVCKIPLATRIKARNLYVLQQLGAPEVAKAVGLKPDQIYSLASREGWTKVRAQIKADSIEKQDARALADNDELVAATAMESAELTLDTFKAAKLAMLEGGPMAAKDVQAWSQATKNYVGIYRQAKQLDQANDAAAGSQINVMFVGSLPRSAERITRNVTPAPAAQQGPSDAAPVIDVASSAT